MTWNNNNSKYNVCTQIAIQGKNKKSVDRLYTNIYLIMRKK